AHLDPSVSGDPLLVLARLWAAERGLPLRHDRIWIARPEVPAAHSRVTDRLGGIRRAQNGIAIEVEDLENALVAGDQFQVLIQHQDAVGNRRHRRFEDLCLARERRLELDPAHLAKQQETEDQDTGDRADREWGGNETEELMLNGGGQERPGQE